MDRIESAPGGHTLAPDEGRVPLRLRHDRRIIHVGKNELAKTPYTGRCRGIIANVQTRIENALKCRSAFDWCIVAKRQQSAALGALSSCVGSGQLCGAAI